MKLCNDPDADRSSSGSPRRRVRRVRRGTTLVEMAIVCPVVLVMLIGTIVAGLGVFRWTQVAALAQESARYASVHGPRYAYFQRARLVTTEDLMRDVIRPRIQGMDTNRLNCQLSWDESCTVATVSIQYQWMPESLFGGMELARTAQILVSY